jgi:hypothetical protein
MFSCRVPKWLGARPHQLQLLAAGQSFGLILKIKFKFISFVWFVLFEYLCFYLEFKKERVIV